jgi:N-terminal domain of anti-restriction factor ArdC
MKQDVYERVTAKIVADLEQGVRPWMTPWNAEHAAGAPHQACGIARRSFTAPSFLSRIPNSSSYSLRRWRISLQLLIRSRSEKPSIFSCHTEASRSSTSFSDCLS